MALVLSLLGPLVIASSGHAEAAASIDGAAQATGDASAGPRGLVILVVFGAVSAALLVGWRGWRPGPLDGPAWRPSPSTGLVMAVTLIAAGVAGAAVGRLLGQSALLAAVVQMIVAALFITERQRWMSRTECHPVAHPWAVIAGAVGLVVAWPIVQLGSVAGSILHLQVVGEATPSLAHESLRELERGGASVASAIIVFNAVIAAPFVEEVLYRGVMQQALRSGGVGRRASIALTSAIFAFMHLGDGAVSGAAAWSALPALFILGLLFGVLFERTGRLAAPIAAHALFNLVNVLALAWGVSS